jgi:O-antigen ligase
VRVVVLGTLVIALAGVWVTKSENIVSFKRELSAEETRNSAEWRKIFAYVSWQMFQEKPLLGVGFGHFPQEKLAFLSDRSTDLHLESIRDYVHHNTFLCLLTETGAIGLGLFLLMFFSWARDGLTVARSPVAPIWARRHAMLMLGALGIYASQLLFHELSYSPLDNLLIFFLAGIQSGLRPLASLAVAASGGAVERADWRAAVAGAPAGCPC